ncbi:MAG: hypothetical protein ABII82_14305 [Verrucomicrobiota bacterium]
MGALHFEHLALGLRFGAGAEVFADALAVEPTGDAENDFPGGIREGSNDERSGLVHLTDLPRKPDKSVAAFS